METAARDRVNGRVQTAPLLYPLSQRFLSGTVGLRGTAHRGNRFLHPPADQSSSRMSGNLNRCGSFGRGSNILYVPEPTHFISAV
jgi:hypothetical protein